MRPGVGTYFLASLLAAICALPCSAQHEHTRKLISNVLRTMGPFPDSAAHHLDVLRVDPIALTDPDHSVCVGFLEAGYLDRTGRNAEALQRIQEVDALSVHDPEVRAQVKNFLGRISFTNDAYEDAIAAYRDVLRLTAPTDTTKLAVTYNNMGRVYERIGDNANALDAFEKSVALYEASRDDPRLAGSLLNLGVVYFADKRFLQAEDRVTRSLAMARDAQMEDVLSIGLETLGNIQRATGRFTEALAQYDEALIICDRIGSLEGAASVQRNIGELYLAMSDPRKALPFLRTSLIMADSLGSLNYLRDAHYQLAEAFRALGVSDSAYAHLQQYTLFKDSILTAERNTAIAAWESRFGLADKERTILAQQVKSEQDQVDLDRKKRQLWLLTGAVVSMLLVAFLLLRDRLRARKLARVRIDVLEQENRISALRGVIEGEERERQRVAGDLHDGVGILLSAARIRMGTNAPGSAEKASELLDQAGTEVRRISHALMPGSLARLGLREALLELADGLNAKGQVHVEVSVHGFRDRLQSQLEVALYRMAQEAIHNALKHAGAQRITVDASVEDGRCIDLTISDDGAGFDPQARNLGHGLENIRTRASLRGGTAVIRSAPGEGTTWQINIPIQKVA